MRGRRRGSNSGAVSRLSQGSISRPSRSSPHRSRASSRLAERLTVEYKASHSNPFNNEEGAVCQSTDQPADSSSQNAEQLLAEDMSDMSVVLQPPPRVRPGERIGSPLVISLKSNGTSDLMPILTVVSEDGRTALAPPAPDLLGGDTNCSLQVLDHGNDKEEAVGLFRGFHLRKPGKYRLRISVMKKQKGSFVNLKNLVTGTIIVDASVQGQTEGAYQRDILQRLRSRGMHI